MFRDIFKTAKLLNLIHDYIKGKFNEASPKELTLTCI